MNRHGAWSEFIGRLSLERPDMFYQMVRIVRLSFVIGLLVGVLIGAGAMSTLR